jgi:hypothetical protein
MTRSEQVFGELAGFYFPVLEKVFAFLNDNTFKYGFVVSSQYDEIIRTDPELAVQIYWQEILLMSHMASVTSLLRSRALLRGACQAVDDDNALSFTCCFRGFLEAASDTYDALGNVPETLIDNRQAIIKNLNKQAGKVIHTIGSIEDQLIHFLRARKLRNGELAPASHKKKNTADYFVSLEKTNQGPVRELYHQLCNLSHPSEESVFFFLRKEPDGHQFLNPAGDPNFAHNIVSKHRAAVDTAFQCGINAGLLLLKVLNEFPLESLHTPLLRDIKFTALPLGRRIGKKLGQTQW